MKVFAAPALWTLVTALSSSALPPAQAGDGVLDLTRLANYASQPVPAYIVQDNTGPGNAITNLGATLGRVLFYDRRLSRNDSISCSSCHQQAHAFGDAATASTGVGGTTGRHSMRLVNARFAREDRFFWDERAGSLEIQTTMPVRDHGEMGFSGAGGDPSFDELLVKLEAVEEYRVLFYLAFGEGAITEAKIQRALAQFVRSIQSFDSRFDAGRAQVANVGNPFPNFTGPENAGKQLFLAPPPNGAGCAGCHSPSEFDIDPASRNNGVTGKIGGGGTDLTNTRTPSLRDLTRPDGGSNGPFMHDGSLTSLAQVIEHYNRIPADNAQLDARLRRPGGQLQNLNLTQQQKNDLESFLRTLAGNAVYTDARWSDPFDGEGRLALIVFPASSTKVQPGQGRAQVSCQTVAGFTYAFQVSSDLVHWTTLNAAVQPDVTGLCQQEVSLNGASFYRFAFVVPAS